MNGTALHTSSQAFAAALKGGIIFAANEGGRQPKISTHLEICELVHWFHRMRAAWG